MPPLFAAKPIQFFVGVFLFIALLNDQRDFTVLSLIILSLYWGTVIWGRAAKTGLHSETKIDKDRLFPDEPFSLGISFANNKFLPVLLQMEIPLNQSLYLFEDQEPPLKECRLLWYQKASFRWRIAAKGRGYHRIGKANIKTGDLFSFCLSNVRIGDDIHVVIYPRLVTLKPFSLPRREFFGRPGGRSPVADPAYFMGTRDYNHRRPSRYIHWKASARHNRLQEKLFEPSEQEKLLIILDVESFSESGAHDELEKSIEVIASMVIEFSRKGYGVGFLSNGRTYFPDQKAIARIDKHPGHISAILEILAGLGNKSECEIMDLLHHHMLLPWDSSCIFFSYRMDDRAERIIEFLRLQSIPTAFVAGGPPDTGTVAGVPSGNTCFNIKDIYYSGIETE